LKLAIVFRCRSTKYPNMASVAAKRRRNKKSLQGVRHNVTCAIQICPSRPFFPRIKYLKLAIVFRCRSTKYPNVGKRRSEAETQQKKPARGPSQRDVCSSNLPVPTTYFP